MAEAEPQEEWTQVRRKPRRNAQQQAAPPHVHIRGTGLSPTLGAHVPAEARLSAPDIQRDHNRQMAQWQESTCRQRLMDLFSAPGRPRPRVSRAVCLGIGSFDPNDGSWWAKRYAHTQLAAFLTIVAALRDQENQRDGQDGSQHENGQQEQPQPIRCFFQEPMFSPSDKEFIRGLGQEFEVVESPQGFELVDDQTLVFGVHLYCDIYSQAIAACVPAVFVGTSLGVWEK